MYVVGRSRASGLFWDLIGHSIRGFGFQSAEVLLHGVFIIKIAARSGLRRFTAPTAAAEASCNLREREKERRRAAIYIYARPRGVVNSTIHLNILHLALFSCCGIHTHTTMHRREREMESVPSGELLPSARGGQFIANCARSRRRTCISNWSQANCASLHFYCSLL